MGLVEQHIDDLEAAGSSGPQLEDAKATRERILESKDTAPTPPSEPEQTTVSPPPSPTVQPEEVHTSTVVSDAPIAQKRTPSRALALGLTIGGAAAIGAGVVLVSHAAWLDQPEYDNGCDAEAAATCEEDLAQREAWIRGAYITAAVVGSVGIPLAVAGAVLLVRRRNARLTVTPTASPTYAGWSLSTRF